MMVSNDFVLTWAFHKKKSHCTFSTVGASIFVVCIWYGRAFSQTTILIKNTRAGFSLTLVILSTSYEKKK
jgi:hypothetical protein